MGFREGAVQINQAVLVFPQGAGLRGWPVLGQGKNKVKDSGIFLFKASVSNSIRRSINP